MMELWKGGSLGGVGLWLIYRLLHKDSFTQQHAIVGIYDKDPPDSDHNRGTVLRYDMEVSHWVVLSRCRHHKEQA